MISELPVCARISSGSLFSFFLCAGLDKSIVTLYTFRVLNFLLEVSYIMAILKTPLLSMGATGSIGKSIVFSTWKGIPTARQHVVPANPQSEAQTVQRDFMTTIVALWHATTRNAYDLASWGILASVASSAMSGFNAFCRDGLAGLRLEYDIFPTSGFGVDVNTGGSLGFAIHTSTGLTMKYQIGLKPTVLGAATAMTEDGGTGNFEATATGIVAGSDYYIKFSTTTATTVIVSGIYKVRALV